MVRPLVLALLLCGAFLPGRGWAVSSAEDDARPVAVPEPSELARSYALTGDWLWVGDEVWSFAVLTLLLVTGASARLRDLARRMGRSWFLTVGLYMVLFSLVVFVIDLPLSYYQGFVRQHAYGLSEQSLGRWLGNALKGLGVSLVVGFLFAWVPYLLLARAARRWWLYTGLLTVPFLFGVVLFKPMWVDPLFNKFGPMRDQALEQKVLAEARRAGIAGSRVFEVDKGRDTKAVNAYVTGVFGTKRIVLWDTLIAKLDERELLFVVGHEMGHYVLGHVVEGILLSALATLGGLFVVDCLGRRLIARYSRRWGFDRLSDVASVPLLLLLLQATALVVAPAANFYSRYQEHEADRFGLELTRANRPAALAFIKLQEENLSVPRPNLFHRVFLSTHPSIGDRIDFCNAYRPWTTGRPLVYGGSFANEGSTRESPTPASNPHLP